MASLIGIPGRAIDSSEAHKACDPRPVIFIANFDQVQKMIVCALLQYADLLAFLTNSLRLDGIST